jgi:hypothetical protein
VIDGVTLTRIPLSSSRRRELRARDFRQLENEVTKMEHLIVVGVVAMMALYAVIIARCLNEPEWK